MKRELWPAYLVLCASVLASFAAACTVSNLVEARTQTQFTDSAEQWTRHIKDGLSKYWALLDSVRALTAANVSMNLGQFQRYVKALDLRKDYPGITGLGVAVKITSAQRAELVQKAQEQGMPPFQLWPPSSAPDLCPIITLEPRDQGNLTALGYDLFATPQLSGVAQSAAERGKAVATETMSALLKGRPAQGYSLFVLMPIYRGGGLPETVEDRRSALIGIVLCAFQPADLLQTIANSRRQPKVDLRICSGSSLIYQSPQNPASAHPLKITKHISVAGQEWALAFTSPGVGKASMLSPAGLTLLVGFIISGLIGAITATEIRARTAAEAHAAQIKELNVGLEQRVADRTAELQSAVEDLKVFSYSVSHDLRAPLRHISAYAALLKENSTVARDEEARSAAERVSKAAKGMGGLVDALLKFAHLGHMDLAPNAEVNVRDLVMEVREMLSSETKDRQIKWVMGELPTVTADRMLLRQVLANLIANAIKYSAPRAEAIIEIGCENNEREFVFYVRDNGVGFDMKYADKLFGVFQRLHRSEQFEGTGIGLASVRKIAARHGGRTWAESQPDQGAAFYFTIPRQRG